MVDEENKDVEPGQEGELWLKGPVIFRGYHNNQPATANALGELPRTLPRVQFGETASLFAI